MTPLAGVRPTEGPPVAGGPPEVDVEDGEALADEDLLERQPVAVALATSDRRAARRRSGHGSRRASRWRRPGRNRLPSTRRPSRAVSWTRWASANRAGRRTAGSESVTRRGRAPSGAAPRTGSSQRSGERRSLSPRATIIVPSALQPTARQTPGHGFTTTRSTSGAGAGRGCFGGRPRGRRAGGAAERGATTRSVTPSWISTWTKRPPSGATSGTNPKSDEGSPCSIAPAVRKLRSCRVGSSRTTWNQPSASEIRVRPPSGSQRGPHSQASPAGIRRSSPPTMSTTETSDLQARSSRWAAKAIRPPSGDQSNSSTSSPAGVIATGSAGRGWAAGRPRRGTGASIRQSCDQPRRRDTKASWSPSGDQRMSR